MIKKIIQLDNHLKAMGLIKIKTQTKLFLILFAGWIAIDIISFYNLIKIKYKFWPLFILYCIVIGIVAPPYILLSGKYPQENIWMHHLYFSLPMVIIGIFLCVFSFLYQKKRLNEYFTTNGYDQVDVDTDQNRLEEK